MGAYNYGRAGDGLPSMYSDFFTVDYGGLDGLGADDVFGPGSDGTLYTDQPTIFAVQAALQRRGFDPGPQDGIFGPKTELALAAFNAQRGDVRRGPPDLASLHALGLQPGGFQYTGADVSTVSMTPSNPSTPAHIPGTIPVSVPVTHPPIAPGSVQLQPQGAPGKQGASSGGFLAGLLKNKTVLIAGGVALAGLVLVPQLGGGGGRRRPARRRRRVARRGRR